MIINTKPITKIRINSLGDLANFKTFMDTNNLKINKSQIARELDVDPRTITKHLEFEEYFTQSRTSNAHTIPAIRFETGKGVQAQLDWKEKINLVLKDTGEVITVNIFVLLLSYSRFRIYRLSISKTQDILLHFLIEAFEGVPHEILTDNMSTVMDDARTISSNGKVNNKFAYFASDTGFNVKPCIAASPKTQAKVESPMKILDEIRAYSGKLSYVELNDLVTKINNRINNKINQGTGRIPINDLQKEKSFLLSLSK